MLRKFKDFVIEVLYFFIITFRKFPIVKNPEDTVNEIIQNHKSICRFGDGEIGLLKNEGVGFQDKSDDIKKSLYNVINDDVDNLLIGIPNIFSYKDLEDTVDETKKFWKVNLILNYKEYKKFDNKKIFYNAFISRPYMRYKNKENAGQAFDKLKQIWQDKEIIFVEGNETKLGIGNDLFNNTQKIERIICPNKNAFSKYDEILKECKKLDKNKLIIIALGPTATVLAYDLAKVGYQALDLGHIDIEYEWFRKGVTEKIKIDGKFTNEVQNLYDTENIEDKEYNEQIICKIL